LPLLKLFFEDKELPNLEFLEESLEDSLAGVKRFLELVPKLRGRGLKLRLGVGVVVVVVAVLKLNLDLVLNGTVLDLEVGGEVVLAGVLVNLALDLDLERSGVALVVGSGTSKAACLLKPALCLEEGVWAGLSFTACFFFNVRTLIIY